MPAIQRARFFFRPSLAMMIHRTGLPLVIVNQASVKDDEAIQTTRAMFENLVSGRKNR